MHRGPKPGYIGYHPGKYPGTGGMMCRLCPGNTPEEQKAEQAEQEELKYKVSELRSMALLIEEMAYGNIDPHSHAASALGPKARSLIRFLATDYL